MARSIRVEIVGDASSLSRAFKQSANEAAGFSGKMSAVGESMKTVGAHMALVGGAVTAVAGVIGKQLVESAVSMQEEMGKLGVALNNQGESLAKLTPQIDALEQSNRGLGFTNADTVRSLTAFTNAGENVQQATQDMGLAADYARTKNESLTAATSSLVKIHQGLLRPLKELGISLPAASDHMKALTEANKAAGTSATAAEKAFAFQQDKAETGAQAIELMRQKLSGVSDAFAGTAAGSMAKFSAQVDNIKESLGSILLPIVEQVATFLDQLAQKFDALSPHTQKLIAFGIAGAAAFAAVMTVVGVAVGALGELATVVGFLAANPLVLVIAGIVALAGAIAAAVLFPKQLESALERMGVSATTAGRIVRDLQNTFAVVKEAAQALESAIRSHWGQIEAIISGLKQIVTGVVAVIEAVWREFGSNIIAYAQNVWTLVKATIQNALKVIEGVVEVFAGILHGNWAEVWNGLKNITAGVLGELGALFTSAVHQFENAASALGKGIHDGILKPLGKLAADVYAKLQELGHAIASVAGEALGWAEGIGKAMVAGILSGLGDLASAVGHKISSGVSDAIHFAGKLRHGSGEFMDTIHLIGEPMVAGIVQGISQTRVQVATALTNAIGEALRAAQTTVNRLQAEINAEQQAETVRQNAKAVADAEAAVAAAVKKGKGVADAEQALLQAQQAVRDNAQQVELTKDQSHLDAVQKAYEGAQTKLQAAQQKAAAQLQAAQDKAGNAYSTLADRVKSAFSAIQGAWEGPAQKQLDAIQAAQQATDRQNAVIDAQNSLVDAQAQLEQMRSDDTGQFSDQSIAEQKQRVVEAQQSLNNAKQAIVNVGLQQEAAAQQVAHDQMNTVLSNQLDAAIAALQAKLTKKGETVGQATKDIATLMGKYDVTFASVGATLGSAFADSLLAAVRDAAEAASKITVAGKSVGISGIPSSVTGSFKYGGSFGGGGMVPGPIGAPVLITAHGGETVTPVGGSGGSSHTFNINVSGGADPHAAAYAVRDELLRILRREPNLFG